MPGPGRCSAYPHGGRLHWTSTDPGRARLQAGTERASSGGRPRAAHPGQWASVGCACRLAPVLRPYGPGSGSRPPSDRRLYRRLRTRSAARSKARRSDTTRVHRRLAPRTKRPWPTRRTGRALGLRLSHTHAVAVAQGAASHEEGSGVPRQVERLSWRGSGTATSCSRPRTADSCALLLALRRKCCPTSPSRRTPPPTAAGRSHSGPGGVVQSYEEALNALELAGRLGLDDPVLRVADLLVYPVLTHDRQAMTDLVHDTLGPLTTARGGAGPLLETLTAYFDSGCVAAPAARRLSLSVWAFTYRLERIHQLTGADPRTLLTVTRCRRPPSGPGSWTGPQKRAEPPRSALADLAHAPPPAIRRPVYGCTRHALARRVTVRSHVLGFSSVTNRDVRCVTKDSAKTW
ncbi:PucR family transcriptional regulator [Streptomyces ambofaciens]|uniref:PucR family transcriptional regulator n=1 Tax=Streptomyces ambofaciens TaxID=1889 RepID=UPI000B0DB397